MKAVSTAVLLIVSFILLSCTGIAKTQGSSTTSTRTVISGAPSFEADVLALVNKYRKTKGLGPLQMHVAITEESRIHSYNMANNVVPFSHDGFNNRSKNLASKIPGLRSVAENVAFGQVTAKEVVDDWIKSPGHKKNIEGNYTQTGIGIVANKKGVLYYTQIFVR